MRFWTIGALVLAAAAFAGCGSTDRFDLKTPGAKLGKIESAQICIQSEQAMQQLAREQPSFPIEQARKELAKACAKGLTVVPEPTYTPVPPAPGCGASPDSGARSTPPRPRVAKPPARRVPFFAPRSGTLPATGTPLVGGIQLPRGSRCMGYWSTDAAVSDPIGLARALARQFSMTGLWPVLWDTGAGEPDADAQNVGDPATAARVDVRKVLHRLWPGVNALAPGVPASAHGSVARDPFGNAEPEPRPMLLLVPVNRPADALSILGGFIATEYMSDAELTAVVRSWEERFGAVLTRMGPGYLRLAVDRPPHGAAQTLALAREHFAFAPDDQDSSKPDPRGLSTQRAWDFGWPD